MYFVRYFKYVIIRPKFKTLSYKGNHISHFRSEVESCLMSHRPMIFYEAYECYYCCTLFHAGSRTCSDPNIVHKKKTLPPYGDQTTPTKKGKTGKDQLAISENATIYWSQRKAVWAVVSALF